MPERDIRPAAAAVVPECRIGEIVSNRKARVIAERFLDGDSSRTISREFGLSRAGVEHLLRKQIRLPRRSSR